MRRDSSSERLTGLLLAAGWIVLVGLGIALVYFGFFRSPGRVAGPSPTPPPATLMPTVPALPTAAPTVTPSPAPTSTPLPSPTPAPIGLTVTPSTARVLVDGDVNVRSGPGTDYAILGTLTAGTEARVTGRSGGWWQIDYNGAPGWVFGEIVTAVDTAGVPEVQPPAAPTAAPTAAATPTSPAPTATPTSGAPPASETRGLVVNNYAVEGAPGPFATGAPIWFNIDITNPTAEEIQYLALGTWVEETGQYQKSYFAVPPAYPSFVPGQRFTHRDSIAIPVAGTYRLWLAIQFKDGVGVRLAGPVTVTVQ
jgi:hypothetical protein